MIKHRIIDMTLTQATKAIKKLIRHTEELRSTFLDQNEPWNHDSNAFPAETAKTLSEFMANEIKYLEKVLKMLQPSKGKKCKHAKKHRDVDPQGKKYCTNCNETLE